MSMFSCVRVLAAVGVVLITGSSGAAFSQQAAPAPVVSDAVRTLGAAIIAAPNDEARWAILQQHAALQTPELDSELYALIDGDKTLTPPAAQGLHHFLRQLALESRDPDIATVALIAAGVDDGKMSNYDAAVAQFEQAKSEAQAANLPRRVVQALVDIGIVHRRRGDLDLARDCYAQALRLYDQITSSTDPALAALKESVSTDQASTLLNLGVLDLDLGNYREALDLNERSLAIFQQRGKPADISLALTDIGVIYAEQFQDDLALEYYRRALAIGEGVDDEEHLIALYNDFGKSAERAGHNDEAETYYNKALALARHNQDARQEATELYNLGGIAHLQKHDAAAIDLLEQSRAIREQKGDANLLQSLELLSEVLLTTGRVGDARDRAQQSVALAREIGTDLLWSAENQLGRVELARKDSAAAEQAFRASIASVEALRTHVAGGVQQQQELFGTLIDPYEELTSLLIDAHRLDEALIISERARARGLLDLMGSGATRITAAMTAAERDRERAVAHDVVLLTQQLNSLHAQRGVDPARIASASAKVQAAQNAQDDFYARLYAAHPDLRAQRGDVPIISMADLSDVVADTGTAAIEFAVTGEHVFVFVARRHVGATSPQLTVHRLAIDSDTLTARTEEFRQKLATRDLDIKQPARALYDALLQPAAADLAGATTIVIAPDGPLWDLPFQALVTPAGHYLIEQAAISLVPSFSALRVMQRASATARPAGSGAVALVFGSSGVPDAPSGAPSGTAMGASAPGALPPLNEAEAQARAIGQIYGASRAHVVVGTNATSARLASEAGNYRIVHIAAHGVLDDASPLHSYLVLSRGPSDPPDASVFEAYGLMQLSLHADLVVLSACESGRGRVGAGEGLIGMSWALFAAGAPSAVASQWQVDAASTTTLMTAFHTAINAELIKSGHVKGRAAALRQAALQMFKTGTYSHPFYWAPFVVIGDGS